MRSTTPEDLAGHCKTCWLNLEICLCDVLPKIPTRTEIVIVRHVAELRLTSNTARFAALSRPNARILEHGGGTHFDDRELSHPGTMLLYSASPRPPLEPPRLDPPPRRLIVLDGSFRQARRMYKKITALRALPELALPVPEVAPIRLRVPPHQAGMSTLEAIAHALRLLEGPEVAAPLLTLYDELVRRVDRHRGRQRDADGNAVS